MKLLRSVFAELAENLAGHLVRTLGIYQWRTQHQFIIHTSMKYDGDLCKQNSANRMHITE